mmetsp:Transcript_5256/g.16892  ORF Transcript_5256/g.16892 Transcript_5256/m.16892 type:complete len:345 (-) Transcript_5256:2802-3836(-)
MVKARRGHRTLRRVDRQPRLRLKVQLEQLVGRPVRRVAAKDVHGVAAHRCRVRGAGGRRQPVRLHARPLVRLKRVLDDILVHRVVRAKATVHDDAATVHDRRVVRPGNRFRLANLVPDVRVFHVRRSDAQRVHVTVEPALVVLTTNDEHGVLGDYRSMANTGSWHQHTRRRLHLAPRAVGHRILEQVGRRRHLAKRGRATEHPQRVVRCIVDQRCAPSSVSLPLRRDALPRASLTALLRPVKSQRVQVAAEGLLGQSTAAQRKEGRRTAATVRVRNGDRVASTRRRHLAVHRQRAHPHVLRANEVRRILKACANAEGGVAAPGTALLRQLGGQRLQNFGEQLRL